MSVRDELRDVPALERDRAGGRVEQPHDAARHRRLAAAGLADDAERLAAVEREADVVHGLDGRDLLLEDDPARDREVLRQVLDLEKLVRHSYNASVANAARILSASRAFVASSRKHACTCVGMHARRDELGQLLLAAIEDIRAARVEPAAAGRRQQRRRLAGNLDEPVDVGLESRQRAEQAPRVRVQRMLEELVDRRLLGHPRRVHDDDLVGDLGDDAEVVGDHDDRGAVVVLELVHQLEDLRLRRHVESRRRLVGDEQSTAR